MKNSAHRAYAKEWLKKAYHDLTSAEILFEHRHYTDTIAVDLHYAIEKILKAFFAARGKKIPKTHNLIYLAQQIEDQIAIDPEDLVIPERYHIEEAYPVADRALPDPKEIEEVLRFTRHLFKEALDILQFSLDEIR